MNFKNITILIFLLAVGLFSLRYGSMTTSWANNNSESNTDISVDCEPNFQAFVSNFANLTLSISSDAAGVVTNTFDVNAVDESILSDSNSHHSVTSNVESGKLWGAFPGLRMFTASACQELVDNQGLQQIKYISEDSNVEIYWAQYIMTPKTSFTEATTDYANIYTDASFDSDNVRVAYGDGDLSDPSPNTYSLGVLIDPQGLTAAEQTSTVSFLLGVH